MKELIGVGLMLTAAFVAAFGALLLKKASGRVTRKVFRNFTNKPLIFGIGLYGAATLISMPAYRFAELSLLYPLIATSYIWTCILSIYFLGEKMNKWKWSGIALIIMGVSFIGIGY